MASNSDAEHARAVQRQRAQINNEGRIRALEAQLRATQIQLGVQESDIDRAVVDAVAQTEQTLNARHEQSRRQTLRQWRAEVANSTQLLQAKDDTIYGLNGQLQIITAAKTALETQVEELEAQVEELENAAPAPADADMPDAVDLITCNVCVDNFDPKTMQNCDEANPALHTVCTECFLNGIRTAFNDSKVDVKCLGGARCGTFYSHKILRTVLPEPDFDRWLILQKQDGVREVETSRDQYWKQHILSGEAQVILSSEEICDEILTNKCPNCRQTWLDFSGCFAVVCGNPQCRTRFCAWCMDFHHSEWHEAHFHVRTCPQSLNPGFFFCPNEDPQDPLGEGKLEQNMRYFKKAHIADRRRRYEEMMQNIAPNLRERVIAKITRERLEEAGIIGDEGATLAREALDEFNTLAQRHEQAAREAATAEAAAAAALAAQNPAFQL